MPSRDDCGVCDRPSSDCTCWTCSGCYDQISENESPCSVCDQCESCCNDGDCYFCSGCDRTRSADTHGQCSNCNRCDNCCNCWTCEGCDNSYSSGEGVSCCDNCNRCTDGCCECRTCAGCDERYRELECADCEHCENCGCDCDEEGEDVERCSVCNRAVTRCYCCQCHTIDPETALITESHQYNPRSRRPEDQYCSSCARCARHCSAEPCSQCSAKSHGRCTFCNRCGDCCSCILCHHGGGQHRLEDADQRCSDCYYCAEHCSCPRCSRCNNKGRGRCLFCQGCRTCCLAEGSECGAFGKEAPVEYRKSGGLRKHIPNRKQLRNLPNPRLIGTEPEMNAVKELGKSRALNAALDKWGDLVVSDGSIGSQPTAFEINTQPSGGDLFLDHMRELYDGLKKIDARPTDACGTHVHIDASDYTTNDLRRLIELYVKVERALYDLCHPSRLGNRFCIVSKDFFRKILADPKEFRKSLNAHLYYSGSKLQDKASDLLSYNFSKQDLDRMGERQRREWAHNQLRCTAETLKHSKREKYADKRYQALNVHSFFLRRTLEFRHHESTTNYEDITGWAMVCQELVSVALRITHRQLQDLPRNSHKALLAVMPERLHPYILEAWRRNKGIREAKSSYKEVYESTWGAAASAE